MRPRRFLLIWLAVTAGTSLAAQDPLQVRDATGRPVRSVVCSGGQEACTPQDTPPATVDASGGSPQAIPKRSVVALAPTTTIDVMTTQIGNGTSRPAAPSLVVPGVAQTYQLSDGTSWASGAGSKQTATVALAGVAVSGGVVRYFFDPPTDGVLFMNTDYDSGDHTAQGTLGETDTLLLEAVVGASTATLKGVATILANDPIATATFHYYSAPVGARVPFEVTYTIANPGGFTADLFNSTFSYTGAGAVSFVTPATASTLSDVSIVGTDAVVGISTFRYRAFARYEDATAREITALASWSVDPSDLAQVVAGTCTTLPTQASPTSFTIGASFADGGGPVTGQILVTYTAAPPVPEAPANTWPMYQANAWHTGHVARSLDPAEFRLRWQQNIGGSYALNPVAAADGKVFVSLVVYFGLVPSLFSVDAATGSVLWSRAFVGSTIPNEGVFSVNPPSYAFGNIYVQTVDNWGDTWLHAFAAADGSRVFKTPFGAQWERYLAPTIYDQKVYVDGGTYGGAYGFDAYTGSTLWYQGLPQYDEWTPAVDTDHVYAYLGEYQPGLYVLDRATGAVDYLIPDPAFNWNGWSMGTAPVLGRHSDVIGVHDGRLINFDTASRSIRWSQNLGYQGQPSVALDAIFVNRGGTLAVLDEVTGSELWTWQPPDMLSGSMIVTDSHVFVSTSSAVHAIDLATHQDVWSLPVSGELALANDCLYVAASNGVLTAIQLVNPPGDANGDGHADLADVFFLINYLFGGGASPQGGAGDVNGDGETDVQDVFFLINYLFAGGPAPI